VSFPSIQFNALKARIQDLEFQILATHLQQLEQTLTKQLHDMVARITESLSHMEAQVNDLILENKVLKMEVNELEIRVQDREKGSLKTLIVHPCERVLEGLESVTSTIPPCDVTPKTRRCLNDELPGPSPSQPTLGKRARCDFPGVSVDGVSTSVDSDRDPIERIGGPLRKRQRLDNDEDPIPFPMGCGATEPVTSTPKHTPLQLYSRPGMGRPEESTVAQLISKSPLKNMHPFSR